MQVGKGSAMKHYNHHATPSHSPHNALHSPSFIGASAHTCGEIGKLSIYMFGTCVFRICASCPICARCNISTLHVDYRQD